jgi:hypothetical protein
VGISLQTQRGLEKLPSSSSMPFFAMVTTPLDQCRPNTAI